jgi:Signal transduction histidine kinase
MLRAAALLLALSVLSAVASGANAELGQPLMEVFGPRDYEASTHNWSAVQDRRGILHVANKEVVLSFGGRRWVSTRTGGLYRTLLALDDQDRIWLGGPDALGFLDEDARGVRRFTSLWDRLPPDDRNYRGTSGLHVLPSGVWFSAWDRQLRWRDGAFAREHELHLPYQPGSHLPCGQAADKSWKIFDGQNWQPLADVLELRDTTIMAIMPQPDGSTLLASRHEGLWRARNGLAERFPTEVDATLFERQIALAMQLRDGTLAVALYPTDFLLLSPRGELLSFIHSDPDGRRTPLVEAFFQDRDDDLWVLRRTGIARLSWPAPLTLFNHANGVPSTSIRAARRLNGRLYLGKSDGLAVLAPPAPAELPAQPARFVPVPGYTDSVWEMIAVGDELVVGGLGGIRIIDAAGNLSQQLLPDDIVLNLLRPRRHPNRVLAGAERGLFVLQRDTDGWRVLGRVEGLDATTSRTVEETDGTIWVSTLNQGFYRLLEASDPLRPTLEHYPGGHGFPEENLRGEVFMSRTGDEPVFLYQNILYRFDSAARTFRPWISAAEHFGSDAVDIVDLHPGVDGALWVRTTRSDTEAGPWGGRQLWRIDVNGAWRQMPFSVTSAAGEILTVTEEPRSDGPGTIAWIGGTEGLVRAELPAAFVQPRSFNTFVREIATSAGIAPLAAALQLPPDEHILRISFGTDRLDDRNLQFQFRLTGRDANWGAFGPANVAAFDYLPAGRYTLHARARDADGRLSAPATLSFVVLPPWWQTWWAKSLYAVAALGLVALFVRWRGHAIRRRNTQLEQLVAVRTTELRDATAAAETANRAKSTFLANMSHELRTPLNAILGYAQILRRETGLSEKGRYQLGIVGRNGEHLLQMINEVLDLAKIEAGKMTLHAAPFPLMRVVKTAADLFEQRAADKGLAFRLEIGAGLPRTVSSDEQKLRQILFNLLGNAVKFTQQGEVVLSATRLNGHVRFEVRDTGPGIPIDQLETIFLPFQQATAAAHAQGTGLGLAISQRLAELLGGRIQVASEPNRGARFWFDLTLPEVTTAEARPASYRTITGYVGSRRRLLVADDEPTNRAVLRDLLEPLGFVIDEATDGAACLAAVERNRFDALFLDLRMPVLGGLDAVPRLRALPQGRSLPIIAVSASVLGFDQNEALAAGCDAFLPKPVQEAHLLETLGRLLRLEWTSRETAAPFDGLLPTANSNGNVPSPAMLEALLQLARRGDVDAVREQIAVALTQGEPGAVFLQELDQLAAAFRIAEIRQRLADALKRHATSPL